MKFLRDISLKQFTAGLLALLFLVLVTEYFVIRTKLRALEDVEMKTDYVRHAQVASQQVALKIQHYAEGQKELNAEIISRLENQDHLLKTLGDGGRIEGSDSFLKPLSRLSKITFDNLERSWKDYKENAVVILIEPEENEITSANLLPPDSTLADTIQHQPIEVNKRISNPRVAMAKTLLAGEWLTLSDWYERLIGDLKQEENQKDNSLNVWFILFVILDLGVLFLAYVVFIQFIIKPIKELEENTAMKIQSKGFPENEIGSLTHQINDTIEQLNDATEFVERIGEGDLEINYRDLDVHYVSGKNKLADSLISMQAKLKALGEEEQKRKWSNEGLAKFVDILRSSNDNIHKLGDSIISALVQYTGSKQGGLYILNDERESNKHLELIALFAFDTKKYDKQKVKLGEGILGQTFLEQETTYLLEIPEDYVRITSGLGEANPKAILIVPLKVDTISYGIVELASFKPYQPHEIAFVEKLGETIASTLASVKSAQRNRQLIEQFQQQTEEMRAQEEEMRQNMEELQATQEEIARKERDYIARIQELESKPQDSYKEELLKLREEIAKKENHYKQLITELEQKLEEKPARGNDWEVAQEVEKALKINLEALRITQQELERRTDKN